MSWLTGETKVVKPPIPSIDVKMVRQACKELAEGMGQLAQALNLWEYPSLITPTYLMEAKHKLHEAIVNIKDAAEMLEKAIPGEQ
jgi:hypothetical protein